MRPGRPSAHEVIRLLDLQPLPEEGGRFRVTWTSSAAAHGTPGRACGSAIYYLLTPGPDGFSAFHVLGTDEIYHFYLGDPVELHLLHPDGSHQGIILGSDLSGGEIPQAVVPGGSAQGSRLVSGGDYALLGTTMAPAYLPEDFHLSSRTELLARFPSQAELITALTRE
jgi:uncharacterized protein